MIYENFDDIPTGRYQCILADPPWRFKAWSAKGLGRAAEQHYPTMTLADIKALPVARVAAKDCWLFLWITGPFMAVGEHVDVMARWGFTPSAIGHSWVKLNASEEEALFFAAVDSFHFGLGHTTRHNPEWCILGRRGEPRRLSKSVRELIVAPVREHSRKPIEAHERIEQFCAGPRLEMFARRQPASPQGADWDLFGNQIAR